MAKLRKTASTSSINAILIVLMLLIALPITVYLVRQSQEFRSRAATVAEEEYGTPWAAADCTAKGGVVLDFEQDSAKWGNGTLNNTVDAAYWDKDPYNVKISRNDPKKTEKIGPYVAQVGNQGTREAFEGPSDAGNSCTAVDWNNPVRSDKINPTSTALVGTYFITDHGTIFTNNSYPNWDGGYGFVFEFAEPVKGFGGFVLDGDAGDWFVIKYFDENGAEINSARDQIGKRTYPGSACSASQQWSDASDGAAKGFEFGVKSDAAGKKISRVEIRYDVVCTSNCDFPASGTTPSLLNGEQQVFSGIGYDHFCIIPASATTNDTTNNTTTPPAGGPPPPPASGSTPVPTSCPTITATPGNTGNFVGGILDFIRGLSGRLAYLFAINTARFPAELPQQCGDATGESCKPIDQCTKGCPVGFGQTPSRCGEGQLCCKPL